MKANTQLGWEFWDNYRNAIDAQLQAKHLFCVNKMHGVKVTFNSQHNNWDVFFLSYDWQLADFLSREVA